VFTSVAAPSAALVPSLKLKDASKAAIMAIKGLNKADR
jgi:hypothetical protein